MPLIDRDALLADIAETIESSGCVNHEKEIMECIECAPAVDLVRRGIWLNFIGDFSTAECDKCGEIYEVSPDAEPREDYFNAFKQFYKFCPSCGAKMDKSKPGDSHQFKTDGDGDG